MRRGTDGVSYEAARQQFQRFINKIRRKQTDDEYDRIIDWDDKVGLEWIESNRYPTPLSSQRKNPSGKDSDR
tara:strand:+ start:663 stop:878 length:216 start_codon:yes stop_codon:yes gene_type:complete